jgi:hypothetical protein
MKEDTTYFSRILTRKKGQTQVKAILNIQVNIYKHG